MAAEQELLGQAHRDRRRGGELLHDLLDRVVERAVVDHLAHETPVGGAGAVHALPRRIICLARVMPISRGSRNVEPLSGVNPRGTNGTQNCAGAGGDDMVARQRQ